MTERKAMITTRQRLPVTRQCQLLAVSRSRAYARAQPISAAGLTFMRVLDEVYLKWPFYGSRRLCTTPTGPSSQSQAGAASDATDGPAGNLSKATDQSPRARTQDLSLPPAWANHRSAQSGLGERYLLQYSHGHPAFKAEAPSAEYAHVVRFHLFTN